MKVTYDDESATLQDGTQDPSRPIPDAARKIEEAAAKIIDLIEAVQTKGLRVSTTTKTPWGEFTIENIIRVAEG